MGADMKFKAKAKLTPEMLRQRLDKEARTLTINIGGSATFTIEQICQLVNMFNDNPYCKTETHCDADFY